MESHVHGTLLHDAPATVTGRAAIAPISASHGHDGFATLPDELVLSVVLALGDDPASVGRWAQTCKRHAAISRDPAVWRHLCAVRYPSALHTHSALFGKDHQWIYRSRLFGSSDTGPNARVLATGQPDPGMLWLYYGDLVNGRALGYGVGIVVRPDAGCTLDNLAEIALDPRVLYGDRYEGQWRDDLPNGIGVYVYPSGARYRGSWVDGKKQGNGVAIYADGSMYIGEWLNDHRHGHGLHIVPGKSVYVGQWKNDMGHATGISISADGDVHVGTWKRGRRHGRGHTMHSDGCAYRGEWNGEAFDGRAMVVKEGGLRYEGGWSTRVSVSHWGSWGRGVCTYLDGSSIDGMWDGRQCLSTIAVVHACGDDGVVCASDPCRACSVLAESAIMNATL
jgi:hypothetical protein